MNYRNKCGYRGISAFLILLMLFIFVSCQTTPDQEAIQNKNDVSKIGFETQVKDDDETLMTGERLICTKEYENGSILSVETIIDNQLSDNAVEVSLEPYSFKNGDEMEEIVQLIYPNQEIYQSMPQRTKEQYQSQILLLQNDIYRLKAGMPMREGMAPTPEQYRAYEIQIREQLIEEYRSAYEAAPYEEHNPADYKLSVGDECTYCSLFTYQNNEGGEREEITFYNDELGSMLMVERADFSKVYQGNIEYSYSFEELNTHKDYVEAREVAENLIEQMGIDYMQLSRSGGENETYGFYYVRSERGLRETYVETHLGSSIVQTDESIAMKLWQPEYLWIVISRGEIVKLTWNNPSIKRGIKEVNLLSWDSIENIFYKQMEYLLTASEYSERYGQSVKINIYHVELGMVKVLEKEGNGYTLIPAWSFIGKDEFISNGDAGMETCFLTINAIDGTIIDRGLMY